MDSRKGTQLEAINYCKKGEQTKEEWHDLKEKGPNWGLNAEFYDWGTPKTQCGDSGRDSQRTDLVAFREAIKAGETDLQLAESNLGAFVRYPRFVDRMRSLIPPVRTEDLKVVLFFGEPDTLKTKEAYAQFPQCYAFPIGKDLWSDGYTMQKEVLVDDFAGEMRLVDLLRFLDRYVIQIPKKFGFNWWCPNVIMITSNVHPKDWYDYSKRKSSEKALRRRIHGIFDFNQKNDIGEAKNVPVNEFWPIEGDEPQPVIDIFGQPIVNDSLELNVTPGDVITIND